MKYLKDNNSISVFFLDTVKTPFLNSGVTGLPYLRVKEINGVKRENKKIEKTASFNLLDKGLNFLFKKGLSDFNFIKNENGKWQANGFNFSISHSGNLIAVAVAKNAVGVDIESLLSFFKKFNNNDKLQALKNKILNEREELKNLNDLPLLWSRKESVFKRLNASRFLPNQINVNNFNTINKIINIYEKEYSFSLCYNDLTNVNYYLYEESGFKNLN